MCGDRVGAADAALRPSTHAVSSRLMRELRRPNSSGPGGPGGAPGGPGGIVWDFFTFDRMLTGRVIHLVYWAGLGVIALMIFSVVGASVGLAMGDGWQGLLLALPVLVAGLLAAGAIGLLWRSFCEFYLAIFRISEDLSAIRAAQAEGAPLPAAQPSASPAAAAPAQPATAQPTPPAASEFRRFF